MKKKMLCGALISVVLVTTAFAQTDLQPAAIVRLTKSEPITVKQFRTTVEQLEKSEGRALTQTERRQVLDSLIDQQLMLQAAERDKLTVSDNELNQQMQDMRNQLAQTLGRAPSDAEFATAIRQQYGLEISAFREQARKQLTIQKYLMAKKGAELQTSIRRPTEAEITSFYNNNSSSFVRPATVRVSMIHVPYGENTASRTRAKVLADRLATEMNSDPAKFDEAVQRGKAASSGYQSDTGYLTRDERGRQMVGDASLNAAFSLKQGEVSRVIEGRNGFQIIKVTETYARKFLELDDMVEPNSDVTVYDYIGNGLYQQLQQEAIAKVSQDLMNELRKGNPFQVFESNLTW